MNIKDPEAEWAAEKGIQLPPPRCDCESLLCPQPHAIPLMGHCLNEATHNTWWTKECEPCWSAKPAKYRKAVT